MATIPTYSAIGSDRHWEAVKRQKAVADCYPLPDFKDSLGGLPLFPDDHIANEVMNKPTRVGEVDYQSYDLYVTQFAQLEGLERLMRTRKYSDLHNLWQLLEKAHRQSHRMMHDLANYSGSVIGGSYLSLAIMHEGVVSLMAQVAKKMGDDEWA